MKNSDIAILKKVLLALEKYLPSDEKNLFDEYSGVFERLDAKNAKEKQASVQSQTYNTHKPYKNVSDDSR